VIRSLLMVSAVTPSNVPMLMMIPL
jgi:hypothetical protein